MDEYIKRESALEELKEELEFNTSMYSVEQNEYINRGLKIAIKDIKRLPKADVVEVVRCKECCFYEEVEYYPNGTKSICRLLKRQLHPDDYCSYGERKITNA